MNKLILVIFLLPGILISTTLAQEENNPYSKEKFEQISSCSGVLVIKS